MVDTDVRRSPRLRAKTRGFKNSSCSSKNCLACNATPPGLPLNLIKAIGVDACMITPGTITEQSLLSKKNQKKAVGPDVKTGVSYSLGFASTSTSSAKLKKKSSFDEMSTNDATNKKKKN